MAETVETVETAEKVETAKTVETARGQQMRWCEGAWGECNRCAHVYVLCTQYLQGGRE